MNNETTDYRTVMSELEKISGEYGNTVTVSTIGKSLVGREIPLVKIGYGSKSVLYVGAHHGMEWITALILLKYIREYLYAVSGRKHIYGVDAECLYRMRSVYIVPMLNPDGTELQIHGKDALNPLTEKLEAVSGGDFSKWQANGRGVDLNHNYDAGFAEYKKAEVSLGITGAAPTRYSGEYPESEPETSALCSFIRTQVPSMLISLHTQGREIYCDYNGHIPHGGRAIAERISSATGYRIAVPEPAASYGGLKDWFIDKFDKPGFTLECGKGTNPLPISDAAEIYRNIAPVLVRAALWI